VSNNRVDVGAVVLRRKEEQAARRSAKPIKNGLLLMSFEVRDLCKTH
jgi:hypothetical protein